MSIPYHPWFVTFWSPVRFGKNHEKLKSIPLDHDGKPAKLHRRESNPGLQCIQLVRGDSVQYCCVLSAMWQSHFRPPQVFKSQFWPHLGAKWAKVV